MMMRELDDKFKKSSYFFKLPPARKCTRRCRFCGCVHTTIRVYSRGSGARMVKSHAALADVHPSITAATPAPKVIVPQPEAG